MVDEEGNVWFQGESTQRHSGWLLEIIGGFLNCTKPPCRHTCSGLILLSSFYLSSSADLNALHKGCLHHDPPSCPPQQVVESPLLEGFKHRLGRHESMMVWGQYILHPQGSFQSCEFVTLQMGSLRHEAVSDLSKACWGKVRSRIELS